MAARDRAESVPFIYTNEGPIAFTLPFEDRRPMALWLMDKADKLKGVFETRA